MDISENTDFTKLSDAELLLIKAKWAIVLDSGIYKKTIDEICRRQQVKEDKAYKTHQKNEKTQTEIKIIAFGTMILTIIILLFTIAQFFKSPVIPAHIEPPAHYEKP